jgi:hypothetical protein
MPSMSIWTIITPAFIASVVTVFWNNYAEKKKSHRDFITKSFDNARDDVRKASEASIEYFSDTAAKTRPKLEAKVLLIERDVRSSVSELLDSSGLEVDPAYKKAQDRFDTFVADLTGGSFQASKGVVDNVQIRRVAASAAALRAALLDLRKAELAKALRDDWFYRPRRWSRDINEWLKS